MSESEDRCPRCRRPIAVVGPRCLYCGAPLEARERPQVLAPATGPARTVLVIDTTPGAPVLAAALGLTVAEAHYRVQRGRLMLYRILGEGEAEAEARRLKERGLSVHRLPESEIRAAARPLLARGGDPEAGSFVVEPDRAEELVGPADVLLIVWGPIRRETVEPERGPMRSQRRPSSGPAPEGELYHIHRRERLRPIEVDPWVFRFASRGRVESSPLRMRDALEALAAGTVIDRSFRLEPPALAPGTAAAIVAGEGVETLLRGSQGGDRKRGAALVLDNVEQFRFHSSWLAAVARRSG